MRIALKAAESKRILVDIAEPVQKVRAYRARLVVVMFYSESTLTICRGPCCTPILCTSTSVCVFGTDEAVGIDAGSALEEETQGCARSSLFLAEHNRQDHLKSLPCFNPPHTNEPVWLRDGTHRLFSVRGIVISLTWAAAAALEPLILG